MTKKHPSLLLLVLVLVIGLLSGCSQAELGFIDVMNQMNDMTVYQTEQTVAISFNKLPEGLNEKDPATAAVIYAMTNQYSFKVSEKCDADRGLVQSNLLLVNNTDGTEQQLFSYVATGNKLYIKVDDLVNFAKTFNNPKIDDQLTMLEGIEYISLSSDEFAEFSGDPKVGASLDLSNTKKQQNLFQEFINGLSREAYDKYSTGLVRKNNNQYVMTIDKESALDTMMSLLEYTVNNAEKIQSFAVDYLNGLDKNELALLSLTPEMRQETLEEIDRNVSEIANDREAILEELKSFRAEAEEGTQFIGDDTKMTLTVDKIAPGKFAQTADLNFSFADPGYPEMSFSFNVKSSSTATAIDSFNVDIPSQGVVSLTELNKRMPKVLTIEADYNFYRLNQGLKSDFGDIDVRMIKGSIYVPLNDMGALLSENLAWDPQKKQVYALTNGDPVNLGSILVDGTPYVKLRDFSNLGYSVTWDKEMMEAVISR